MTAVWNAMAGCLYVATMAEVSGTVRVVSGIASAVLYVGMILTPYLWAKRKGSEQTLRLYLISLFEH